MSNIVDFKTKSKVEPDLTKPAIEGPALCIACHHTWVAIAAPGQDIIECPNCHTYRGLFNCVIAPKGEVWTCSCMCQMFHINVHGAVCMKCGNVQSRLRIHAME